MGSYRLHQTAFATDAAAHASLKKNYRSFALWLSSSTSSETSLERNQEDVSDDKSPQIVHSCTNFQYQGQWLSASANHLCESGAATPAGPKNLHREEDSLWCCWIRTPVQSKQTNSTQTQSLNIWVYLHITQMCAWVFPLMYLSLTAATNWWW